MHNRDIIVIGGSTGALAALRRVLRGFPVRFPAAIFVVIHTAPNGPGVLSVVLASAGALPAGHPVDGEEIGPGRIHVAPPDHHPPIESGHARLTRGPRENRFRPAIDPLFRTAAAAYSPRVIGVILSGGAATASSACGASNGRAGSPSSRSQEMRRYRACRRPRSGRSTSATCSRPMTSPRPWRLRGAPVEEDILPEAGDEGRERREPLPRA